MKITLFLFLLFSIPSYSQVKFEKGYIINNDNQKIKCLIKNIDWNNNPGKISYKKNKGSKINIGNIKTVKEFSIEGKSKYIRASIKYDSSPRKIDNLDNNPEFNYIEETIFLKVLIEGKASLYNLTYGDYDFFFFNIDNEPIEWLAYKKYNHKNKTIREVTAYQSQLLTNLDCGESNFKHIKKVTYSKKSLIKYFAEYNSCNNVEFTDHTKKNNLKLFNIYIRPGLNYSSLNLDYKSFPIRTVDFGSKLNLRLGLEFEALMPFNHNKWALFIEPTYQYFNAEKNTNGIVANIKYRSLEIPLGIRHYLYLNEMSKIFLEGAFVFETDFNSTIDFKDLATLDIASGINYAFGLGYTYKNKYSLQFRYFTKRDVLVHFLIGTREYNTMSLIFGYNLSKQK